MPAQQQKNKAVILDWDSTSADAYRRTYRPKVYCVYGDLVPDAQDCEKVKDAKELSMKLLVIAQDKR